MKKIETAEADRLVREASNLSLTERQKLQKERLSALVSYARENSPYFKALYENIPDDFTLEDLPITEKSELLSNYNDWVTDRELTEDKVRAYLARSESDTSLLLGKYTALQTSGSTGNPLIMVRDDYHNKIHGAVLRQRLFTGVAPGLFDHSKHKTAFIVHISNSASSYNSYVKMRKLRPGFENNIIALPIMENINNIVKSLNEFQPEIIIAYPPVLVMLAEEKERGALDIPLKLILSSAEVLTEESFCRISSVFGCPILNNYCMTEGGEIAMTNGCSHLHINDDWVIVEPVDEERRIIRDGEAFSSGILVTDLTNYVQPIIRYFVSDSIRIRKETEPCCQRPIMEIQGRIWQPFVLDGKKFSTKALEVKAKFQKALCQYQFVQTDDNVMEIRGICAADADKAAVLGELCEKIKKYFTEAGCNNIKVDFADKPLIQNVNGGKTPLYIRI